MSTGLNIGVSALAHQGRAVPTLCSVRNSDGGVLLAPLRAGGDRNMSAWRWIWRKQQRGCDLDHVICQKAKRKGTGRVVVMH